ncbi:MAG: anti-sigma factor family protein [Desulfobaccales bacterium]
MTWRCTLIQARLPAYPDGDLSPFWRRLIEAHLKVCPRCRRELEEIAEVVRLYRSEPLPDPGSDFWEEFERELHLKLVQLNQSPEPRPRRLRLPHYVMGATALAGILALAVYLGPFAQRALSPQMAQPPTASKPQELTRHQETPESQQAFSATPKAQPEAASRSALKEAAGPAKATPTEMVKPKPAPAEDTEVRLAAGQVGIPEKAVHGEDELFAEDDFLSWDVDSLVADLSPEEQQNLKARLESRR